MQQGRDCAVEAWETADWQAASNQHDLRNLLVRKLAEHQLVAAADVQAAADIIMAKSKGQFIYIKYVVSDMRGSSAAGADAKCLRSLADISKLPEGLHMCYANTLRDADTVLMEAGKAQLAGVMRHKLLPLLCVMKEAVPAGFLAWVAGEQEQEVSWVLQLLYSLFPSKPGEGDELYVMPYHKSVTDFLLGREESPPAAQDWQTPEAEAHSLVVQRLLPQLLAPTMRHWQQPCAPQVLAGCPPAWRAYCLQHVLDHMHAAQAWSSMHQLVQ